MQLQRRIPRAGALIVAAALLTGCSAADAEGSGERAAEARSTASGVVAQNAPLVTLYKNPTCECCADWGKHMEANGFRVDTKETGFDLNQIKAEHGVSPDLASCHTAVVGDYVLEGHVPADVVQKLLTERPQIRGLAVPGMPPGVPGMPDPGPNRAPYQILAIQPDGSTQLYATR